MATLRDIRRRIRSVRNISQVTRAMQMVAASKMRRAQQQVLATRPYSEKSWEVLQSLARQRAAGQGLHPLLVQRPEVNAIDIILVTSDRGLCGAYNNTIIRTMMQFALSQPGKEIRLVTVGRRGRDFLSRRGYRIMAEFTDLPPRPQLLDVTPIARTVIDDFLSGQADEVYLVYTKFVNTLTYRTVVQRLLPIHPFDSDEVGANGSDGAAVGEYIYEPDPATILDTVLPRFTELQVYQALLDALASEHSARMVAMRSATDNARDLLGDLQLSYNQARQTAITTEMLDIAGGAEAMSQARG